MLHDAITGPVEEFLTGESALGYDEAKPGEHVRAHRRRRACASREEPAYRRFAHLRDRRSRQVDGRAAAPDRIEFVHELDDANGYAYVYRKMLRLDERHAGARASSEEHRHASRSRPASTTTTSSRSIGRPTGPDIVVRFPFDAEGGAPARTSWPRFAASEIAFLPRVRAEGRPSSPRSRASAPTASDYDFRIENRKTGAGVRITGDRPLVEAGVLVGVEDGVSRSRTSTSASSRARNRPGGSPTSSTRPQRPLTETDRMMNRRDAITSLSMAGGASLIPSGEAIAGAIAPEAVVGVRAGGARHRAGQDPRHQDHPDRAQPHPPRRREGGDDRAGPGRLGLRDVHAARARRQDGDRRVPEAVPRSAATSTRSRTSGSRAT